MRSMKTYRLTFSIRPAISKQEGRGSGINFSGIAYSGGVIRSYRQFGDVAIDLSTLRNSDGDVVPLLVDHENSISAIAGRGSVRRASSDSGAVRLLIDGVTTDATDVGRQIASLIADGHPVELSVGMTAKIRQVNGEIDVNGQRLRVDNLFYDPEVREVSFVALGADGGARVSFSLQDNDMEHMEQKMDEPKSTVQSDPEKDALRARIAALEAEIARMREDGRKKEVFALFKEIGRDAPDGDTMKPYLEMSDASFAAFCADIRAVHAAARPKDTSIFESDSLRRSGSSTQKNPRDILFKAVDDLIKT